MPVVASTALVIPARYGLGHRMKRMRGGSRILDAPILIVTTSSHTANWRPFRADQEG